MTRALADNDRRWKRNLMPAADPRYVFVRVMKGFWVRLDACVAVTACPMCDAPRGEPCRAATGLPMAGTHYKRRYKASGRPFPMSEKIDCPRCDKRVTVTYTSRGTQRIHGHDCPHGVPCKRPPSNVGLPMGGNECALCVAAKADNPESYIDDEPSGGPP